MRRKLAVERLEERTPLAVDLSVMAGGGAMVEIAGTAGCDQIELDLGDNSRAVIKTGAGNDGVIVRGGDNVTLEIDPNAPDGGDDDAVTVELGNAGVVTLFEGPTADETDTFSVLAGNNLDLTVVPAAQDEPLPTDPVSFDVVLTGREVVGDTGDDNGQAMGVLTVDPAGVLSVTLVFNRVGPPATLELAEADFGTPTDQAILELFPAPVSAVAWQSVGDSDGVGHLTANTPADETTIEDLLSLPTDYALLLTDSNGVAVRGQLGLLANA